MVKQTKKGSIGKKALSAILAASMIMTSSSFVMAAPVVEEVEAVAVEESVAAEVVETSEEVVGDLDNPLLDKNLEVKFEGGLDTKTLQYNGEAQTPDFAIKYTHEDGTVADLEEGTDYKVTYYNNTEVSLTEAGIAEDLKTYAMIEFIGNYASLDPIQKDFTITECDITNAEVTYSSMRGFVYNGQEQYPTITSARIKVMGDDGKEKYLELTAEDYDVVAVSGDLINADETKQVTIEGKGKFTGKSSASQTYNIDKADASTELLSVNSPVIKYDGSADFNTIADKIIVTDKAQKQTLSKGADFVPRFLQADGSYVYNKADMSIGTHKFRIYIKETNTNYNAETYIDGTYEVVKSATLAMEKAAVTGFDNEDGVLTATYTGADLCKKDSDGFVDVKLGNLVAGKDYKVVTKASEWKNVGEYSIQVEGMNMYEGETLTIPVKITPKALNTSATDAASNIDVDAKYGTTNSGNDGSVILKVKDGTTVLEEGTDYTYSVVTEKGVTYVVITGKGNYTTTINNGKITTLKMKADKNAKLDLNDPSISVKVNKEYTYEGKKIQLTSGDFTVVENDSVKPNTLTAADFYVSGYELNDSPVSAINGAGEYTVTLTARGTKYSGTREVKVNVAGKSFGEYFQVATDLLKDLEYNALDQTAAADKMIKVTYKNSSASLPSSNYDVKYYLDGDMENEVDVNEIGTYTAVITPNEGEYAGTLTATFRVIGSSIKGATVEPIADQDWTGSAIEPAVKVILNKDTAKEETLVKDKDYTVSYDNNVKSGTAYVIVEGIGKYSGKIVSSFNIVGEMTQDIVVLPAQEKALQSRNLNDKATKVKYTTAPETTVTYKSSAEDVVTVDAEGNIKYTGLGTATITIEAAAENGYKAATKELKVVVGLKQPTFSPSSKNNAFTVTTSTVKGAEKFQVQYVPTGKSFTSSTAKTKTFTVDKKLVKGKISAANKETYRVRVRAISGTTKSKWSPVKTIATK